MSGAPQDDPWTLPAAPGGPGDRGLGPPPGERPPPAPVRLRPVRALGTAALAVAAVVTLGEGFAALTAPGYDAARFPSTYDVATGLTGLAWVVSFVVTCLWLGRARRNAEELSPAHHHVRGRAWVWWGWLVPVVSFWFPYQVVRDTAGASAAGSPGRAAPRPPLAVWWATWLAGHVLANAASQVTAPFTGAGFPTAGAVLHLLAFAACAVSLLAWARVVRAVVALQEDAG
ncbi:DUF4328 domain-containing protein [Kineococcus sp. SYSU DK004]|uniref:DUF4328 domain-containing protein n=1 Tax=Kineococcus sp. SYSU DK004 TaxID=3383125 RepID=UPI003D7E2A82